MSERGNRGMTTQPLRKFSDSWLRFMQIMLSGIAMRWRKGSVIKQCSLDSEIIIGNHPIYL